MKALKRFLVEGEIIDAVESGRIKVDPTDLRDYAREKGLEGLSAYAERLITSRNKFLDSLV